MAWVSYDIFREVPCYLEVIGENCKPESEGLVHVYAIIIIIIIILLL